MDREQTPSVSTDRYNKKKDAIIAAAAGIINRRGVKGMTLADVAASVDLITTSVTYYFKKKEDLAVACFLRGIERLDAIVTRAMDAHTPHDRLFKVVGLCLEMDRHIREGDEAPLAMFSDVRTLREPHAALIAEPYRNLFRKIRSFFVAPGYEWLDKKTSTVRTHMLLEQLYWSVTWLPRYDVEDYPRIQERMFDILANGLVIPGGAWEPLALAPLPSLPADPQERLHDTFLLAATKLINHRGYRGASVEKISAQLNVTKGSFYHHNDAKDDLVVACFERTFETMRQAQTLAMRSDGNVWQKLSGAAATLVEYQLSDRGPLLRSSALSALPEPIRSGMVDRFNRVSDRFAAMISDGIAEKSVRAVDPYIAAQMLNATLNAASDLTFVLPIEQQEVAALYAKPMLMGIFSR
jgi:AcrR family transcriptional regulator